MKKFTIALVTIFLLTACSPQNKPQPTSTDVSGEISSFEECQAAGYPVLESYPSSCRTPAGASFVQDIGNEIELAAEIVLQAPRPTATVAVPITIQGSATGAWFFEGSMTAELIDADEEVLGQAILEAQGEWMTTEFVDFTGTLELAQPYTGKATLLIKNANPSGLPENEKVLRVPLVIAE